MLTDYKRIYDEPETKEPVKHEKPVLYTFREKKINCL